MTICLISEILQVKRMTDNDLVDFVLNQPADSQNFDYCQMINALTLMKLFEKIDNVALYKLWVENCAALGVDPKNGSLSRSEFVSIATRASLLPGPPFLAACCHCVVLSLNSAV